MILTGQGSAFSAGYDVSEGEDMPARNPAYWTRHFGLAFATLKRIWRLPQPVVAKVRGACLGGGFSLSLACDLTYAGEDAFFGDPEVKFGGTGNMFPVLQWAIGMKKLNELMLTGRFIRAPEALAIGIVNEVVAGEELDARVDQIVRHMLLLPDGTLAANKRLSRRYFEAMGFSALAEMAEDACALGLGAGAENEFTRRSKAEGVGSALRWQRRRFGEVGAFP